MIFLAGAFGSTWAGFQSDKIGRKKSILADLIFLMAGNTVVGMSKSFTVLMLGRVLNGLGSGGKVWT